MSQAIGLGVINNVVRFVVICHFLPFPESANVNLLVNAYRSTIRRSGQGGLEDMPGHERHSFDPLVVELFMKLARDCVDIQWCEHAA
jgi:hypothetical protein